MFSLSDGLVSARVLIPATVTPAEAGVQRLCLDSRFRGNDPVELIPLRTFGVQDKRLKHGLPIVLHAHDDPVPLRRQLQRLLRAAVVGILALGVVVMHQQLQRYAGVTTGIF